jgi:hypothetical protein
MEVMMGRSSLLALVVLSLAVMPVIGDEVSVPSVMQGEAVAPDAIAEGIVETMEEVLQRDVALRARQEAVRVGPPEPNRPVWAVPAHGATGTPHSGRHNIVNKWGATRIGIGFPRVVHLHGAYIAGQGGEALWPDAVRASGYRDGDLVATTPWFRGIGSQPEWFAMDLAGIDRVVIEAQPALGDAAWYALDDVTYEFTDADADEARKIVVDFDDAAYNQVLTDTPYAGLRWEEGEGGLVDGNAVPAPESPVPYRVPDGAVDPADGPDGERAVWTNATPPVLISSFRGTVRGDAGQGSYPPDTCGAVGIDHFVVTVNTVMAVFRKSDGQKIQEMSLSAFLPGASGDPRILFDQHSNRWVVIISNFSNRIYLAVSLTSDPTGAWFKTNINVAQGQDSSRWPDYPTLGVDAHGIYTSAFMVPSGMSIFAIDKEPILRDPPVMGRVTAFRGLQFEGAIQPAHTFGDSGGVYLVSSVSNSTVRLRQIVPPLTDPRLVNLGDINVAGSAFPRDVPALGSNVPLDSVDQRLMNAAYRDGYIWTGHNTLWSEKTAARWYQIDPVRRRVRQWGQLLDATRYFWFPAVMVNECGDMAMGVSGSSTTQYAAAYFSGRLNSDPLGENAAAQLYRQGDGPQNNIDGYGRNRWGDYSLTSLDPTDERTFWTIQEYGHGTNIWGTWVAQLRFEPGPIVEFVGCMTGPEVAHGACCEEADYDKDGDVDLYDYGQFQIDFVEP